MSTLLQYYIEHCRYSLLIFENVSKISNLFSNRERYIFKITHLVATISRHHITKVT